MPEKIRCPYQGETESSRHEFNLGVQTKDGNTVYYCEKCKVVISVQNDRVLRILESLADKFGLQ